MKLLESIVWLTVVHFFAMIGWLAFCDWLSEFFRERTRRKAARERHEADIRYAERLGAMHGRMLSLAAKRDREQLAKGGKE